MRTLSKLGSLLVLAGSLSLSSCAGSYYVAEQPSEVIYTRPAAPYSGAVWIEGDWVWSGGHYIHRNGYWSKPRTGHTYESGRWVHTSRGYAWQKGHWR